MGVVPTFEPVFALSSVPTRDISVCKFSLQGAGVDTVSWRGVLIDSVLAGAFTPYGKAMKQVGSVCQISADGGTVPSGVNIDVVGQYEATELRPRFYQWYEGTKSWKSLETVMNRTNRSVRASIPAGGAIVGIFVDTTNVYTGTTSWYRDKRYARGGATHLFPLGTMVKATNTQNGKSVVVKIVSTWANIHPGRLIDLTSTAFQEIGNLSQGVLPITLEKVTATEVK